MIDNSKFKKYTDEFSHYNLGCGPDEKSKPFLNIDYYSGGPLEDFKKINDIYYLNYDLTKGVPAPDNSLEAIFSSHFLEHLTFLDGTFVLQECYRALKPNGRMRLVVPDLEFWIDAYLKNKSYYFNTYLKLDRYKDIKHLFLTKASVLNLALYDHGHKAVYDFETLFFILNNIGFKNINRTLYCDGSLDLHQNDVFVRGDIFQDSLRSTESLYIECVK